MPKQRSMKNNFCRRKRSNKYGSKGRRMVSSSVKLVSTSLTDTVGRVPFDPFLYHRKSERRNFSKQDDALAVCLVVTAKDSTVPKPKHATEHDLQLADSSYIIAIYFRRTFFNIISSLLPDCPYDRFPKGNWFQFSVYILSYT